MKLIEILFHFFLGAATDRVMGKKKSGEPCSGVEALPIYVQVGKCIAATCDADCKAKHPKSGHGECYTVAFPDDTCKCDWNDC